MYSRKRTFNNNSQKWLRKDDSDSTELRYAYTNQNYDQKYSHISSFQISKRNDETCSHYQIDAYGLSVTLFEEAVSEGLLLPHQNSFMFAKLLTGVNRKKELYKYLKLLNKYESLDEIQEEIDNFISGTEVSKRSKVVNDNVNNNTVENQPANDLFDQQLSLTANPAPNNRGYIYSKFWEITYPGRSNKSYLFGTFHDVSVTKEKILAIPGFKPALLKADHVFTESNHVKVPDVDLNPTPILDMNNIHIRDSIRYIANRLNYPKEKLLYNLKPKSFIELYRFCIDMDMYLDKQIAFLAHEQHIQTHSLETYWENFWISLESNKKQGNIYLQNVNLSDYKDKINYINQHWGSLVLESYTKPYDDPDMQRSYTNEYFNNEFVTCYLTDEDILVKRDENFVNKLRPYLENDISIFCAVGAAHLPGMLRRLEQQGYSLKPIGSDEYKQKRIYDLVGIQEDREVVLQLIKDLKVSKGDYWWMSEEKYIVKAMFNAILQADYCMIQLLLEEGLNPFLMVHNEYENRYASIVRFAIESGDPKIIEIFKKHFPIIDPNNPLTPQGSIDIMKKLGAMIDLQQDHMDHPDVNDIGTLPLDSDLPPPLEDNTPEYFTQEPSSPIQITSTPLSVFAPAQTSSNTFTLDPALGSLLDDDELLDLPPECLGQTDQGSSNKRSL